MDIGMHRAVSRTQLRHRFGPGPSPGSGPGRSQEPMVPGDFEDPRHRGILRKSGCHRYRERLEGDQQGNLVQALMMLTAMALVMAVLWLQTVEPSPGIELGEKSRVAGALRALFLGVSDILGLHMDTDNGTGTGTGTGSGTGTKRTQPAGPGGTLSPRYTHCHQKLDTKRIFQQIGRQVLNQEKALAQLERVAHNDRPVRSAALVGPPGVGKSLTAMLLRQHFPWPENVHSYSWSTYVPDSARKFKVMRNFVDQLSGCGQNLLIVDNLTPCDHNFVSIYNDLLTQREGDAELAAKQSILVIYIFTLETQNYWQEFEMLQQLPMDTTIINYRAFGRADLMSCLENELLLEQHTLDMHTLSLILEEALRDVEEVGCKRIRQMLVQHGLPGPL